MGRGKQLATCLQKKYQVPRKNELKKRPEGAPQAGRVRPMKAEKEKGDKILQGSFLAIPNPKIGEKKRR